MSEKIKQDRKIGFQNTFYTKCTNTIIDTIGPSINLRSIVEVVVCLFCCFTSQVNVNLKLVSDLYNCICICK